MTSIVRIREDVHVHAPAHALQQRILDLSTYEEWLAPQIRDFRADDEGWSGTLVLPGRTERARLRRGGTEAGAVTFVRDGDGAVDALTWAMHSESPREVHLTVELAYVPAGGLGGNIMEMTVHRPHRVQALRDWLWRLKQLMEHPTGS